MQPLTKTSFTYPLTEAQQLLLAEILRQGNYRPLLMEHTLIAAETDDCKVALYKSGKCLVQGKGAADFVAFVLEPKVLASAGIGYEEILHPEAYTPHMGIDESGKGDFFGPLVIAGAYIDKALASTMLKMGVKDSKNISSDKRLLELARDIRNMLGQRFSLVLIGPEAYNRLYAKMRSVNLLLAWGHARAIENLLAHVPDCPRAISDQFGDKQQVRRALMRKARKIILEQRHRAEGSHDCHGNRDQRYQRSPPVLQEGEHDQSHQQDSHQPDQNFRDRDALHEQVFRWITGRTVSAAAASAVPPVDS